MQDTDDKGGAFRVPIEDELDLHTFSPRDAASVVEEYIRECRIRGITPVRIVHGRGKGVRRAEVRRRLSRLEGVVSFDDDSPAYGGWGATVVELEPLARTPFDPSSGD